MYPLIMIVFAFSMNPAEGYHGLSLLKLCLIEFVIFSCGFWEMYTTPMVYGRGDEILLATPFKKDAVPVKHLISVEQVYRLPFKQPEVRLSFSCKTRFGFTVKFWPTDKYGAAKWFGIHPLIPKLRQYCNSGRRAPSEKEQSEI